MPAQQKSTELEVYRDEWVEFCYPKSCSIKAVIQYRQYFILEGRKLCCEIRPVSADEGANIRSEIESTTLVSDAQITRKAIRQGAVVFQFSHGIERLVVGRQSGRNRITASNWMFLLRAGETELLVNVVATGALDEARWLKCIDSIRIQGTGRFGVDEREG